MDIKNKLFKFRRAIHRNGDLIARVFSVTLIIILVVAVGWGAYKIYWSDIAYEKANAIEIIDDAISAGKAPEEDREAFELVADKDGLELWSNFTNGEIKVVEKDTGNVWYSNPVDRQDAALPVRKPMINSQIHVKFFNVEKKEPVDQEFNNYGDSIRKGCMEYEKLADGSGVKFRFGFPIANVYIPVQYRIVDGAFQAEIVTDEIEGVGTYPYAILDIKLLPYFGAANESQSGELLVPDGSGALIDFNNGKNHNDIVFYNNTVYGNNITLGQETAETVKEQISLPIFGSKWDGSEVVADDDEEDSDSEITPDKAFLGVIISGDASSSIVASTSGKVSSYNMIHPVVHMTEHQFIRTGTSVFAGQEARVLAVSDNQLINKNFAVRYYFLNGDKANYVGMAEKYREHLQEANLLKKSALADEKYMILDLVGAVSIEKYVFGVKKPVVTALTTYNDVVSIVKELKAEGVDNLVINYIGALDGGLNNKMYSTVETESVLGSKKEFRAMLEYLDQEGVIFFLEANPVDVYNNGNGYDTNADTAKTFFNKYAFQHNFILDSEQKDNTSRWNILHPAKLPGFVTEFVDATEKWEIDNVSLDRIGKVLYTDYADDVPSTTRTHSMEFWKEALKYADEKSDYVMIHGGNAYTLAYSDIVTDVANGSSDFDLTDHTVPFYQIALQGSAVLAPTAFNMSVDYEREMLKVLENGGNLKYNLIYGDVDQLVGTEYDDMVSYSYKRWKEKIVEHYKTLQEVSAQFAGKDILAHETVAEDVTVTTYENGTVIVNYRDEAYTYEGMNIPAKQYKVVLGGTK
ncbi:MAG: hypothetical protein IJ403_05850 [Oscillospiraceae bacterium]|nr:hypothetical protein [Oscillospiraceae bacterium]